jgi:nitrogenase molybdenum-iron protein alpha chain
MNPETPKPIENSQVVKDDLIRRYPVKTGRKRAKQFLVNNPSAEPRQEIGANVRTIPGILTQRGCTYAGCKGVILGPTRDILNLVHGPIGCSFYAWLTRRNQTRPPTADAANFMNYCFSTDMQDENIIFGGEKKLRAAVEEAYAIFKPKAIGIFSTCPVGLIGDDVHAVARDMSEKLGINVFGFSCEGYKGVSQSAGHHIANNQLFKHVIGRKADAPEGKFKVNLLGEYNIGGDGFVIDDLFQRCGLSLLSTFSGNSTYDSFAQAHHADLNAVMCHRSINYVAEMIEKKYGIPWIKVNFIGVDATAKSLRKIAQYFENADLMKQVDAVISEELAKVREVQEDVKKRCAGKTTMLFVGGSRAHHYQELFKEIGMKVLAAGYEFGHRDDYEGRSVLPTIKVDADSRTIEELVVKPDETLYRPRKSPEDMERLAKAGLEFKKYEGLMSDMEPESLIIDDINHYETEILIQKYRPDIFCAGIKEKYVIQKLGVPLKQLHSYDSGGPYAGFAGAVNFYKDIDRMLSAKALKLIRPPWEQGVPLTAEFATLD